MVGLGLSREDGETWKDAALRMARPWGLEIEVAEWYDSEVARGEPEDQAAWAACYEWDVPALVDTED